MKLKLLVLYAVIIFTAGMCVADELTTSLVSKRKIQNLPINLEYKSDEISIPDNSEYVVNRKVEELPIYFKPYKFQKDEVLFSESKSWINVINPNSWNNKAGQGFPGYRGANQLIVYTSDYGTRTNTNEYGAEAIIVGNTVTELSGADSLIPADGFVISGHGKAKMWINSSLGIGTKVYIDKDTNFIYAYKTSESYIFETEKKIAEAEDMLKYYKSQSSDYNWKVPSTYIDDAKSYLKDAKKHHDEVQKYAKLAVAAANDSLKSVLPYKNGELKGVWVRPSETSAVDIISTLDRIKSAGIDTVFLETYFHGKTIYPSEVMKYYGFTPQYEKFVGLDPLNIWIKEAHKRNIKVYTWFETFYVGNENPNNKEDSILSVHSDWANKLKRDVDSDNISKSSAEHNGYFLDPANPEVRDFLAKLVEEIITKYKPDGINIDYIRYPNSIANSESSNWGYTNAARSDFYMIYGVDPVELKRTDSLYSDWNNYKREQVTNMIKKFGQLGKQYNVDTTAVIFPDMNAAFNNKFQDWRTWSVRGYINGFTPLFLTCDSKTASKMMTDVIKNTAYTTNFYAGLFVTFMNGSDEDLIRQIHEARKVNAKGVIIFDYAHLGNKYINTLSKSVFAPNTSNKKNVDERKNRRLLFR